VYFLDPDSSDNYKIYFFNTRTDNKVKEVFLLSLHSSGENQHGQQILTMIGGAALLVKGVLTPAITVTSSLKDCDSSILTSCNTDSPAGICYSFFIQQFGSNFISISFGPLMMIWFLMLGRSWFCSVGSASGYSASR